MSKAHLQTSRGEIIIDLFEDDAPQTVANFVALINGTKEWTDPKTGEKQTKPYYDGLRFHRVIPNFMIQGGDPFTRYESEKARWGQGGPGFTIPDEFRGTKQKHLRGSLSMANRGPNTGGSQFFICHAPQPHLNGKHTVFGLVEKGLEIVDQIQGGDQIVKAWIA